MWSCPLDAGVKRMEMIHSRRWLSSPIHRGEHGAAEKNHRAGNAGSCRRPVVTMLVGRLPFSAHEAAGAPAPGIPCALYSPRDTDFRESPGATCAAGMRRCVLPLSSRASEHLAARKRRQVASADPGPITTGLSVAMGGSDSLTQRLRPVVMGPRSRAQLRTRRGRQVSCCLTSRIGNGGQAFRPTLTARLP